MERLTLNILACLCMIGLFILAQFKGRKRLPIIALLIMTGLSSCSKDNDSEPYIVESKATVRLYSTNMVVATKAITAEIDGRNYGRISYSAGAPACGQGNFGKIELVAGTYIVDVIDASNSYATRQVTIVVAKEYTTCQTFNLK
jgi:hypothetical protein